MRQIYSSRGLEEACRENIKFMYLLEGTPAPDHNTIARFRTKRLVEAGEIDLSSVYIDGTKIEAAANRYTFVWKKPVEKRIGKLKEKVVEEWARVEKWNELHGTRPKKIQTHHVKNC